MTIVFTLHGDLELVHLDWLKGNKRNHKKTVIIDKLHEAEQRNVALGLDKEGRTTKDIQHRLSKARQAFYRMHWGGSRKMKAQLYKKNCSSVLMYGCEAWKLTKTEGKKLDGFQYKCMKMIQRIRWPPSISHQQIQENKGVKRTSNEIRHLIWNWIGHIMRKDREQYCITALEWRPEGRRRPGLPKTTWRRMVEDERKTAGWQSWANVRTLAANCCWGWRENSKPYVGAKEWNSSKENNQLFQWSERQITLFHVFG